MNKTLLLIICDFLLLNLLALTRWEDAEPPQPATPAPAAAAAQGPVATPQQDMVDLMKISLEEEKAARDQLARELQDTQKSLDSTATSLAERDRNLDTLAREKSSLESNLAATRDSAAQLERNLQQAQESASVSRERLEQLQREFEAKQAEAARQAEEVARLASAQAEAQERIQKLNTAVEVAAREKELLSETASTLRQQVAEERTERERVQQTASQLASGVGELAERSANLAQEIRDNRPVSVNAFFNELLANRVQTSFIAQRQGLLGAITRQREARTVFVSDGKDVFALLHAEDTPLSVRETPADWSRLTGEFSHGRYQGRITELRFLARDPRIVAIPVPAEQAAQIGAKIYTTAQEPFKFPEAILVSNGGKGYGEVAFKLDPAQPGFVKMDNRFFKRLSGEFSPSTGDLVFSKTGEFLGIMVNSDYCAVVDNFLPAQVIPTGEKMEDPVAVGEKLENLTRRYRALPLRMQ